MCSSSPDLFRPPSADDDKGEEEEEEEEEDEEDPIELCILDPKND